MYAIYKLHQCSFLLENAEIFSFQQKRELKVYILTHQQILINPDLQNWILESLKTMHSAFDSNQIWEKARNISQSLLFFCWCGYERYNIRESVCVWKCQCGRFLWVIMYTHTQYPGTCSSDVLQSCWEPRSQNGPNQTAPRPLWSAWTHHDAHAPPHARLGSENAQIHTHNQCWLIAKYQKHVLSRILSRIRSYYSYSERTIFARSWR